MAKYSKTKQGYFETSRVVNGKRVRFRGKTCAEVDRKLLEFDANKKQGRKLSDIADEWWDTASGSVRPATMIAYKHSFDCFKDFFGSKRAGDVKPIDCRRFLKEYESKGYTKSTMRTYTTVMKQIMRHAVLQGDIDISPASEVVPSKGLQQNKRSALTEEQEKRVEEYRGDDYLLGLFFLYTGMRRGELFALTWQDIDLANGIIHVNKKLDYAGKNTPTIDHKLKSANGMRDIPILDDLRAALPKGKHIGLVFPNKRGTYMTMRDGYERWKRYQKNVGGLDGITFHCFRHSFATILYEAGLDAKSSADIFGDTENIMREVYQELRESQKATNAEKVNAYLAIRRKEKAAEC